MAARFDQSDADFERQFAALLAARQDSLAGVEDAVRDIVAGVAQDGDRALLAYTETFDRLTLTADTMRVSPGEIAAAVDAIDGDTKTALETAAERIETFHAKQLPDNQRYTDALGVDLGLIWTPIEAVGVYVPGGTAAYPSSVLMNAVPARVAGVGRIAMTVPTPDGMLNPLVLAAASLAGVDEIYRVGGAQAIAALAFGTDTIAPVAKIVGPGNAYVAAAKRQVFGTVGIDMVAGPSEVLVIADADNRPDWLAADLLAQAEHDPAAQSVLITTSATLADEVAAAVETALADLPRRDTAGASWRDFGAIITVASLADAAALANRIAPEHLELAVAEPDQLLPAIRNAGAVFLGRHTPEAIGDYVGGPNHVLPTGRSARFSSGLSVYDFLKRTTVLGCGPEQLEQLGPSAMRLAEAEGLDAHRRSIALRLKD